MRTSARGIKMELLVALLLEKANPENDVNRAIIQWIGFISTTEGFDRIRKSNEIVTLYTSHKASVESKLTQNLHAFMKVRHPHAMHKRRFKEKLLRNRSIVALLISITKDGRVHSKDEPGIGASRG
jgi:hypothetical protein